MKKYGMLTILTAMTLEFGCLGTAHAEIIQPYEPGQQIGYPAVALCQALSLRENPDSSSRAIQTLYYGALPIVVNADLPETVLYTVR